MDRQIDTPELEKTLNYIAGRLDLAQLNLKEVRKCLTRDLSDKNNRRYLSDSIRQLMSEIDGTYQASEGEREVDKNLMEFYEDLTIKKIKYTHSENCNETNEFIKENELELCPKCERKVCSSCLNWGDEDKECSSCRLCNGCNKSAKDTEDGLISRCLNCLEKYCSECWGKGDEDYCEGCAEDLNLKECEECGVIFPSEQLSNCSECKKLVCDYSLTSEEEGEEEFCGDCWSKITGERKLNGGN